MSEKTADQLQQENRVLEHKLAIAKESKSLASVGLSPTNAGELNTMANMLARSDLVPEALRNKPANVALVLMWSAELRIGTAQGLGSINPIEGKASLSSELMRALILRHPDCEYFDLEDLTDDSCTYVTKRKGRPREVRMTYTMEDARRAKLDHKRNWQQDPKAMLSARATSRLGRVAWADVLMGLIIEDEADEIRKNQPAMTAPLAPEPEKPEPEAGSIEDILEGESIQDGEIEDVEVDPEPDTEPEVVEEEPIPSLEDRLHAVVTMEQLQSLRPEIKDAPAEDQGILRAIYEGKRIDIENSKKGDGA